MKIFLSYTHDDTNIVNTIDKSIQSQLGIKPERDIRDVGPWQSFSEFMNSVSDADYVMPVISDKYLKSRNCMYEVNETMRDRSYKDRIFPIVLDSAIYDAKTRVQYVKFWQDRAEELDKEVRQLNIENMGPLAQEVKFSKSIASSMAEFLSTVADRNNPDVVKSANEVVDFLRQRLGLDTSVKATDSASPSTSTTGTTAARDYFKDFGIEKKTIPHNFTDLEKEEFIRSGYNIVITGITGMCQQYSQENRVYKLLTEKLTDHDLKVSIYKDGNLQHQFRIGWSNSILAGGMAGIFTSDDVEIYRAARSGHSFSGMYDVRVDANNNELYFDGTMVIFYGGGSILDAKGVTAAIWKINIEPYLR